MIWTKVLLAVAGISLVSASADNAVDSSILHESRRAVTPTGTQIGVNPVEIDPTQTKILTVDPVRTNILTVNTELLTDLPYITTVDNKPTITTASAKFAASVVTNPDLKGAVAIQMNETAADAFQRIVDKIEASVPADKTYTCGAGKSRVKRASCSLRLKQLVEATMQAVEDGTISLATNANLPMKWASPELVQLGIEATGVVQLLLAAYVIVSKAGNGAKVGTAITLPKEAVNIGVPQGEKPPSCPTDLKCEDCGGTSLNQCASPWPGCPCEAAEACPLERPECPDEKCKGEGKEGDKLCTVEHKGCSCAECTEDPELMPDCVNQACQGDNGTETCTVKFKGASKCGCNNFGDFYEPYMPDFSKIPGINFQPNFTLPNNNNSKPDDNNDSKPNGTQNLCLTLKDGDEEKKFDWGRASKAITSFCGAGPGFNLSGESQWFAFNYTKEDINMILHLAIQRPRVSSDDRDALKIKGFKPTPDPNAPTFLDQKTCEEQFMAGLNECQTDSFPMKSGVYPRTFVEEKSGYSMYAWMIGHSPGWSCADHNSSPECAGPHVPIDTEPDAQPPPEPTQAKPSTTTQAQTSNAPAPKPTPNPNLKYEEHCTEGSQYRMFDRHETDDAINNFCKGGIDVGIGADGYIYKTYKFFATRNQKEDVNLHFAVGWASQRKNLVSQQDGCNGYNGNNTIGERDCINQFTYARDSCKINQNSANDKWGQDPLMWNSPAGCVEFFLAAFPTKMDDGQDWNCGNVLRKDNGAGKVFYCKGKAR